MKIQKWYDTLGKIIKTRTPFLARFGQLIDADVDKRSFFLEPDIAWNDSSVCVSCEKSQHRQARGTRTSARPLWKLPV